MVARFGWRPFFLALGLVALLWLAPWWPWMPRRTTRRHAGNQATVGILHILRQRSAWGTCLGQSHQLHAVFSGDVAAVLSDTRPPSFHESDGQSGGIGLSHVLGFRDCRESSRIGGSPRDLLRRGYARRCLDAGLMRLGSFAGRCGLCTRERFHWVAGAGRNFPRDQRLQLLGSNRRPWQARMVRPLDRRAEFHRQLRRRGGSVAHRIPAGPHRPVLLARLHHRGGFLDWRAQLGVHSGSDRTGGLGEEIRPGALPHRSHSGDGCGHRNTLFLMPQEIEIKFRVDDLRALARKLRAAGSVWTRRAPTR